MRIRLTSPMGWMLGPIFLAVGVLSLVTGLFRWDVFAVVFGFVVATVGAGAFVATIQEASWIELDPDGFTLRKGARQERVRWDELAEVTLKPAWKSVSVQIGWRRDERAKLRTFSLSGGLYQTSHVENTLKWYWHHPERRFKLKRGAEGNLGPFPSRVYDPTRKRSEVDEAER